MKGNSRAYNRDISYRKAKRKKRITNAIFSGYWEQHDYYDNLHQYSKNKIHCSCPCCSPKTRNKGNRKRKVTGNYSRHLSYKWSDLKKVISMDMDEFETLGKRTSKKRKNDR